MSFRDNSEFSESFAQGTISASGSLEHPIVWLRNKIAARINRYNIIPHFYRNALQYIISKLGTLGYMNNEGQIIDVKCIHANPERAIAKLKQENNIILPIISINQVSSDNADDRRRPAFQLINETFWSEEKKRAVRVVSVAPRAVDIEYTINVWSKYKADLDQLVEQIRLLFNPELTVKTEYTNVAQAFIDSESDESTLETADREERILRRSFKVKLEGYIPNPRFIITSTGEIEEFKMEATIYEKK